MPSALTLLFANCLLLNIAGFALFGLDKHRAEIGAWRIRESTLLNVALLGGWLGCYAGQARFKHKTRKRPFVTQLLLASTVNVTLMGFAIGWFA